METYLMNLRRHFFCKKIFTIRTSPESFGNFPEYSGIIAGRDRRISRMARMARDAFGCFLRGFPLEFQT
jgi:hypothetical protein